MKINEIFTPGKFPQWTYVDDHLKDKEQQLVDTLEDGSMLVSISGPSKSGKTVFVEKVLGKDNIIPLTGAGIKTPNELWLRTFNAIGTPIKTTTTTGSSISASGAGKLSASGGLLIAKGGGEISASASYGKNNSTSNVESIDHLQLLIHEFKDTDFVIFIDDFHYIPQSVQSEIAQQIKEAMRHGVKFICASVPYHSDDVIRSNPDLRGRLFSIDFDYWNNDVLKKIAFKGAHKANLNFDCKLVNSLVSEAAGSPQLMQYLCLNACYVKEIRETPSSQINFDYNSEFINSICHKTIPSANYSSIAEKMLEGPKTRGSDRKVYIMKDDKQGDVYKLLLKALALDPPLLTFRYQVLKDRIESLCKSAFPSGSSVTNACHHLAEIANTAAKNNIVEWDSGNDVFDIRDPYLLFYLRWSNINQR